MRGKANTLDKTAIHPRITPAYAGKSNAETVLPEGK